LYFSILRIHKLYSMKNLYLSAVIPFFIGAAMAQPAPKSIYYTVSFPNAVHHEADIVMTIPQAPAGTIKVRMSRSSAGRYATHEFGKNIYNVKAFNSDGSPVTIKQIEGDVYEIADHQDVVKVSYTLFANHTDGTYASIDGSHAHLNMPAAFMWVVGQDNRPLKFEFNDLDKYGWKVATQLKHEGASVYSAPNMQYMMDSPTELSDFKETSWDVVNPDGKKQRINLTVHADDDQQTIEKFGTMVKKVVSEAKAVFGEFPAYDFGEYTFLDDVYSSNSGDGMEHRNSTCIVQVYPKVAGNETRLLGTFAHEYFHSWNVKRIRPKPLEPFNFEHANMSSELWFAEGFTQYYGEMLLIRAGFDTPEQYSRSLTSLLNTVLTAPGAQRFPATQMSRNAVFTDAGVSIDPNNNANVFTSYYTYGGAIAVALDLRLRSEFNLTLDDYMRTVWLDRGKVMKPYVVADLQYELAKLTKNPKFAADFFSRYITGVEKNDYAVLLQKAGYLLQKAQPGKAWMGQLGGGRGGRNRTAQAPAVTTNAFTVPSNTIIGTPIYNAGIDVGDVIVSADGKEIKTAEDLNDIAAAKKPGDKITVAYKNRTGQHEASITLVENPTLEVVTFETAGKTLSKEQMAFRNNWLSSKAK
jgi:predicted metalloprotease with PDZ domain